MSVFDDAIADIYADPNFGFAASYTPPGGSAQAITIQKEVPDPDALGLDRFAVAPVKQSITLIAHVRRAQVPAPVNESAVVVAAHVAGGVAVAAQAYTLKRSRLARDGQEWLWDLEPI